MRLRQICLVAPDLDPVVGDIAGIMGLQVCFRDSNAAKYGLQNALLPVDTTLLEVVAPFQPGTAAGRFLDKTAGHGGYMAIFSCDDPDERGRNAQTMGVRIANVIAHAPYHGVQLHPRDCRAAFIEFNHTAGSEDILGPYPPAGPDWQAAIRTDVTKRLVAVEMQSPAPADLAAHWGRIIGIPVTRSPNGSATLALINCAFHFVVGDSETMSALTFQVSDVTAVRTAAATRGYTTSDASFSLGGVRFHIIA